jgi:hypothetical protein
LADPLVVGGSFRPIMIRQAVAKMPFAGCRRASWPFRKTFLTKSQNRPLKF